MLVTSFFLLQGRPCGRPPSAAVLGRRTITGEPLREIPNFAELGAIPKELLEDLVRISAEQQASRDERNSSNQDVIESQFADGFKLLGMASSLAASIGETLRTRWFEEYAGQDGETSTSSYDDSISDKHLYQLMLILLHAKACTIAEEVRLLLASGFEGAVEARLRALHECLVFSLPGIHRSGN